MENNLRLKGILNLSLVPVALAVLATATIAYSLFDVFTLLVMISFALLLYFMFLLQEVSYTDSTVLDIVRIPNAPPEIEELLKKRTRDGRLINIGLIRILGMKRKLHQTDFAKLLESDGITLTAPAVTGYLLKLEEAKIFVRSKGIYTIDYSLDQKGKWCYHAVRLCFPKRYLLFLVRHYLKKRQLPRFPDENETL